MRNKTFISSMVGVAAAVAVAGSANAGIPAFTTAFSPVNATITTDAGNGNDLLVFTVGASDIAVTSLGLFNGYIGTRDVGIYAWNGSTNSGFGPALGQASVTTNNSTTGYTYSSPTNFTLTAGQQYVVVGQSKSGMASNTAAYADAGAGAGIVFNSTRTTVPVRSIPPLAIRSTLRPTSTRTSSSPSFQPPAPSRWSAPPASSPLVAVAPDITLHFAPASADVHTPRPRAHPRLGACVRWASRGAHPLLGRTRRRSTDFILR